jgi:ADP-ribose pyrophosphatase
MRPDSRERVYRGRQFDVHVERWGNREREVVSHPGSVAIVAVDDHDRVVLVRQTRAPARTRLLELPAGTVEAGEEPLETARRELAEETGLRGGAWRPLARFWTSPGFLAERMHLFLAEGVQPGEARPQSDEDVELVHWPLPEVERVLDQVEDAKTLAGLLLLLRTRPG